MEEYYILSRFSYWKYYFLILYYRLSEFAPVVRVWVVFMAICLFTGIGLVLAIQIKATLHIRDSRLTAEAMDKWYDKFITIATEVRTLSPLEIADILILPKGYKMKSRVCRYLVPVLQEVRHDVESREDLEINKANWLRMLQALKMPLYFEEQVRSRNLKNRVAAFKYVADLDCPLKEAVASRYLFTNDAKLKICARIHAARFGSSYPFKPLDEDPKLVFTEELMVKYHNVLVYRQENNLTMPNFIRWCKREPMNEQLRIFAVNEIRLFRKKEDCAELLKMLRQSHDEAFSCAIIRALGELRYIKAEDEFCSRYVSASFTERTVLAEALGAINSGRRDILDFLKDDYLHTTDNVTRMKLLRVIRGYGSDGPAVYESLKASADSNTIGLFNHIECDLIDSRKYA